MRAPEAYDEPPSQIPWPPLLIIATIGAGAVLDVFLPLPFPWPGLARVVGAAVILLAVAADIWCAVLFWRRGTTIRPDRPVARLVTDGPFRRSRNPIYVSHVALTAGLGLALGSPWTILLLPALVFGLTRLAIEPEERHLTRKFGYEYEAYVARTPRWL